jgi:DnaJ-class molecular chaperone
MIVEKALCVDCGGSGHAEVTCRCLGGVAFIVGCCRRCGGEGYVRVKPSGIVLTDATDKAGAP